eukprot:1157690-Pelagomonas_calceolata.AAC.6
MLRRTNPVTGPILHAVRQGAPWKAFPLTVSSHSLTEEALICSSSRNSSSSVGRGAEEVSTSFSRDTNELSPHRGWLRRTVKQKGDESFTGTQQYYDMPSLVAHELAQQLFLL